MNMCEDWLYMYLCAVCDKQILVLILQYSCILINICINYLAKHQTLWLTLVYLTFFFPVDVLINSIIRIGIILKLQYCIAIRIKSNTNRIFKIGSTDECMQNYNFLKRVLKEDLRSALDLIPYH